MKPGTNEAGFSLIETLVSLSIISVMTGLFFQAVGINAVAAHDLSQRRAAVMLAQSILAQATLPKTGLRSIDAGTWHGMAWRVGHRQIGGGARDTGPALEDVRIDILDAATGKRLTSVRTLRIAQ